MIESAEEFVALRTTREPDDYRRAAHEAATDVVWFDVIERFPEMRIWVAQNKTSSHAVLERLATDQDPRVRHTVAMANRADESLRRALALDPDDGVRAAVARHKKTPIDIVHLLATDPSWVVREAARRRPSGSS